MFKQICTIGFSFVAILLTVSIQVHTVSSNDRISKTDNDFYSYFIREAPRHHGHYQADIAMKDIPWLEPDLILRATRYYERHFLGISLSQLYGLIEAVALKSTSSVLLSTGMFNNASIAYTRLLKTVMNVRKWSNSGLKIFDPSSEAYRSLQIVRQRHSSASHVYKQRNFNDIYESSRAIEDLGGHKALARALREDLTFVDTSDAPVHLLQWNSTTPVGQFDLGVVQFLFYCHSTMTPEAYGVKRSASTEDRKAFIHLWAVLGRLLGIEDRFNVALNLPHNKYKHFYRNIVVANLKNIDDITMSFMVNSMQGWYNHFLVPTNMRLKCWLYYALKSSVDDFQGRNIMKLMDAEDRICLVYFSIGKSAANSNLSKIFTITNRLVFDSWFDNEIQKYAISY